jgi:hypothetical protein
MNGWPVWNYWMYDGNGAYIYRYEHTMDDHPDFEFLRDTYYEPEWAHKFFWSVDEAAALSFGRSPTKVRHDEYMDAMNGSSKFATCFCDLRAEILTAQREGVLPSEIPAQMYVEWAERRELPFPPPLARDVRSFFDAVMGRQKEDDETAQIETERERGSDIGNHKISGPELRRHRTLLGIVYALAWKYHRFGAQTKNGVATSILNVLDELRAEMPVTKVEGGLRTITGYLDEALQHFGSPPKKDRLG